MCARCQVCELKSTYEEKQSIDRETTLEWILHKPDLAPLERRPKPITLKPKRLRKTSVSKLQSGTDHTVYMGAVTSRTS